MSEKRIERGEALAVLACCAAASCVAAGWSWKHDALLNYGDAEAHLHIARRILDSHRPGIAQLGSVWLPMPHLLILPFVAVFAWWRDGIAGLIPSALAWMASCWAMYGLARHWLRPAPAALALAFFALNPNLLYLQTTAMSEPLFVCEMVWTVLLLVKWHVALDSGERRRSDRLTWAIALTLVAATLTRYDGWIMAAIGWTGVGVILLRRGRLSSRAFWWATMLVVGAPILWFAYNQVVFGDWLDFARGPYSARAIELRTATPGAGPPHPGWHNPWVSLIFFVKVSEMVSAGERWGNLLLVVSVCGALWGWLTARRRAFAWSLLLWLPVPFYTYSVAYGSVPIFLPVWWPHSWYNTRYGLEMLPAFALGVGFAASLTIAAAGEIRARWPRYAVMLVFALVVANSGEMLRERPLVYVEGTKNAMARRPYEAAISSALRAQLKRRPEGIVLMDTSVYPHIVALSDIPLRQTINESDKEYYQAALADPAHHAFLIVSLAGDPIEKAVREHPEGLRVVGHFTAEYQPAVTIYVSDTPPRPVEAAAVVPVIASGKE